MALYIGCTVVYIKVTMSQTCLTCIHVSIPCLAICIVPILLLLFCKATTPVIYSYMTKYPVADNYSSTVCIVLNKHTYYIKSINGAMVVK